MVVVMIISFSFSIDKMLKRKQSLIPVAVTPLPVPQEPIKQTVQSPAAEGGNNKDNKRFRHPKANKKPNKFNYLEHVHKQAEEKKKKLEVEQRARDKQRRKDEIAQNQKKKERNNSRKQYLNNRTSRGQVKLSAMAPKLLEKLMASK